MRCSQYTVGSSQAPTWTLVVSMALMGDPDPAVAVEDVLPTQTFDEVIISTRPTGLPSG